MKHARKMIARVAFTMLMLVAAMAAQAQGFAVKGHIVDSQGDGIIGATVSVKGQPKTATVSDFDGNFSITVPSEKSVLVISYVGMKTEEVKVAGKRHLEVSLEDDSNVLDEAVVVGYGQQKKSSVVGAITQTTGEVLERAAGIGSVGAALTGNLPGVTTIASTGQPGEEDPRIYIRGAAAWNQDAQPLILVDGIKRPIQSVDITSVATISVLKDASATAVYGVEGANGVILITTKRGLEGKAKIDIGFIATMKTVSKLPRKYDSYDGYLMRNQAIEHELALGGSSSWAYYRPQSFINNFRNQDYTVKPQYGYDENGNWVYLGDYSQAERYPNVDWQEELFKDHVMSYNTNLNIMGGTKFVKYFVAFDLQNEGDLAKIWDNRQGYEGGWSYNRLNVRSNLDFQITNTTQLKVNLAGSNAQQKAPRTYWGNNGEFFQQQRWAGAYGMPPNLFVPQYSDGSWGYSKESNVVNSAQQVSTSGYKLTTNTRIATDFVLEQKLDFITKGLVARGSVSWDNIFTEGSNPNNARGISDTHEIKQKFIVPETGMVVSPNTTLNSAGFDYYEDRNWSTNAGALDNAHRQTYVSAQLYWGRQLGKHNVTAMGNWTRRTTASNSDLEDRREDWVFRTTYDFNGRYFAEFNGAYNGSQKFSADHRFAFFCSGALGWMVSEEAFMKKLKEKKIVDMFKIRGSYGEIGDDAAGDRWAYMTRWEVTNQFPMNTTLQNSPYTGYKESVIGNPDLRWAVVAKKNIGFDYAFLGGMFAGSFDFFRDDRRDVFVSGGSRAVPAYFGAAKAPDVNKGKMKNEGYELELRFNKVLSNGMRFWANTNMTHARNSIVVKDDPELIPNYRKEAGYAVGQYRSFIDKGFISSYDELYSVPVRDANDSQILIGDHYIVDFNGDGKVDQTNDQAPYGYSGTPENTYNATIGFDWKGWSCFVQFYGVTGVTRDVGITSFQDKRLTVYDNGTWWNPVDGNGSVVPARYTTQVSYNDGTQFLYDGSYARLKNVELAYTWRDGWVKNIGFTSIKVYINGNNLWLWTKMPDDRESNYGFSGGGGAYPTVKRFNLGIKVNI